MFMCEQVSQTGRVQGCQTQFKSEHARQSQCFYQDAADVELVTAPLTEKSQRTLSCNKKKLTKNLVQLDTKPCEYKFFSLLLKEQHPDFIFKHTNAGVAAVPLCR